MRDKIGYIDVIAHAVGKSRTAVENAAKICGLSSMDKNDIADIMIAVKHAPPAGRKAEMTSHNVKRYDTKLLERMVAWITTHPGCRMNRIQVQFNKSHSSVCYLLFHAPEIYEEDDGKLYKNVDIRHGNGV